MRGYRYAIVVTEKQVKTPADELRDGVTYRHINIAVDPDTPSRAAQRAGRGRKMTSAPIEGNVSGQERESDGGSREA